MTEELATRDAYLRECPARVVAADAGGVILDRTVFYPRGGGQPGDTGRLEWAGGTAVVTDTVREEGAVRHLVAAGELPAVGTAVRAVIDWERRHLLMRTHTALHVLSALVWREYGAKVTGGNMEPGQARMDFELEAMSVEFGREVEERLNAMLSASHAVRVMLLPRAEALADPDLIRTKVSLIPEHIDPVRVVDIAGLDRQADGGTHVADTREVGRVRVVKTESKGKGNKRMRIELDAPSGMIDALLVALLLFLLVRGWYRGLVREALDLVGLVAGTVLAFRFGPLLGGVISSMANLSDDTGRLVGGLVLLVGTGVAAAFLARAIEPRVRRPGINLIDRAGGAILATGWAAFLLMVLLSLLLVLPLPAAVGRQLDGSAVTRLLTDPGGVPQAVFRSLSGDRVIQALLQLREAVGERQVIVEGDESIALPPADPGDLADDTAAATEVFELLNRARVDAGLAPLAWSPALSEVAAGHAREMYLEGYFSHRSPATGTVGDRLTAAGITYSLAGENLALAASVTQVHDGLMGSPGHRENILRPEFRRVGVGVVSGPLGLMTVQVFTG